MSDTLRIWLFTSLVALVLPVDREPSRFADDYEQRRHRDRRVSTVASANTCIPPRLLPTTPLADAPWLTGHGVQLLGFLTPPPPLALANGGQVRGGGGAAHSVAPNERQHLPLLPSFPDPVHAHDVWCVVGDRRHNVPVRIRGKEVLRWQRNKSRTLHSLRFALLTLRHFRPCVARAPLLSHASGKSTASMRPAAAATTTPAPPPLRLVLDVASFDVLAPDLSPQGEGSAWFETRPLQTLFLALSPPTAVAVALDDAMRAARARQRHASRAAGKQLPSDDDDDDDDEGQGGADHDGSLVGKRGGDAGGTRARAAQRQCIDAARLRFGRWIGRGAVEMEKREAAVAATAAAAAVLAHSEAAPLAVDLDLDRGDAEGPPEGASRAGRGQTSVSVAGQMGLTLLEAPPPSDLIEQRATPQAEAHVEEPAVVDDGGAAAALAQTQGWGDFELGAECAGSQTFTYDPAEALGIHSTRPTAAAQLDGERDAVMAGGGEADGAGLDWESMLDVASQASEAAHAQLECGSSGGEGTAPRATDPGWFGAGPGRSSSAAAFAQVARGTQGAAAGADVRPSNLAPPTVPAPSALPSSAATAATTLFTPSHPGARGEPAAVAHASRPALSETQLAEARGVEERRRRQQQPAGAMAVWDASLVTSTTTATATTTTAALSSPSSSAVEATLAPSSSPPRLAPRSARRRVVNDADDVAFEGDTEPIATTSSSGPTTSATASTSTKPPEETREEGTAPWLLTPSPIQTAAPTVPARVAAAAAAAAAASPGGSQVAGRVQGVAAPASAAAFRAAQPRVGRFVAVPLSSSSVSPPPTAERQRPPEPSPLARSAEAATTAAAATGESPGGVRVSGGSAGVVGEGTTARDAAEVMTFPFSIGATTQSASGSAGQGGEGEEPAGAAEAGKDASSLEAAAASAAAAVAARTQAEEGEEDEVESIDDPSSGLTRGTRDDGGGRRGAAATGRADGAAKVGGVARPVSGWRRTPGARRESIEESMRGASRTHHAVRGGVGDKDDDDEEDEEIIESSLTTPASASLVPRGEPPAPSKPTATARGGPATASATAGTAATSAVPSLISAAVAKPSVAIAQTTDRATVGHVGAETPAHRESGADGIGVGVDVDADEVLGPAAARSRISTPLRKGASAGVGGSGSPRDAGSPPSARALRIAVAQRAALRRGGRASSRGERDGGSRSVSVASTAAGGGGAGGSRASSVVRGAALDGADGLRPYDAAPRRSAAGVAGEDEESTDKSMSGTRVAQATADGPTAAKVVSRSEGESEARTKREGHATPTKQRTEAAPVRLASPPKRKAEADAEGADSTKRGRKEEAKRRLAALLAQIQD